MAVASTGRFDATGSAIVAMAATRSTVGVNQTID